MRANLDATGGLALAEHVAMVLAAKVGREAAQRLVRAAASRAAGGGRSFRDELLGDPEVAAHLEPADVDAALDPRGYLGSTPALIDRALSRLEASARERGSAVGVASALPASIERIAQWIKAAEGRGIMLVPISSVAIKPKSS